MRHGTAPQGAVRYVSQGGARSFVVCCVALSLGLVSHGTAVGDRFGEERHVPALSGLARAGSHGKEWCALVLYGVVWSVDARHDRVSLLW